MRLLLQQFIDLDAARQPAASPEIAYADVILSAVGVTGLIMLAAALVGLLTGGIIIYFKKRREAGRPTTETAHARLRLS